MQPKQETFKVTIEGEEIEVVMQMASPFKLLTIQGKMIVNGASESGMGVVAQELISTICVSPKNLVQRIEESYDVSVLAEVYKRVRIFCGMEKLTKV